jgi:6-phospho-beta-galactosidase
MDYICFDYYDPFVENMFRFPRFDEMIQQNLKLRDWIVHSFTSKWWDWRVLPQGLRFFVELYARDFPKLPIIVAENGMALRQADAADHLWREDYISRSDYIRKHLQVVNELRQEGLPINGYFHWSLTDNYEWGSYIPRFGLFNIDFDSPDLTRRSHDLRGDQPAQTYAEMIQTSKKPSGEAL